MQRFPKLSLAIAVAGLLALSSSGLQVAVAEPAAGPLAPESAGTTCEAGLNTARDAAAQARLADLQTRLQAAEVDPDTIPLNGSGYNYTSDVRVSNELLFMDAELQRRGQGH